MRKNKIALYLMTVLLLLVLILSELILMSDIPFSVVVKTDTGSENIKCWENGDVLYVFLPSGADADEVKLAVDPLLPVWIDGQRVGGGTVCGDFPFFAELSLTYRKLGRSYEKSVFFCQSANVPTLYIDTASGSMDYIHEEKGNAEAGFLRLYRTDGTLDSSAQIMRINGRGNGTWVGNKKPYSMELNQKADLLGMGAAKRWILLADYLDPTGIHNKMCYDFAAAAGCAYSPECQWVDLYLNGNYEGLYLLSERNEVDPQRVDIPESDSFLICKELEFNSEGRSYSAIHSHREFFYRIHHAGMEEDWIREIWQSVEDAIYAEDGIDPRTGRSLEELIDLDSWAQQYLMWDCFMDLDAAFTSKYFYYDPDSDLVFAGPIWDMDHIFYGIDGLPISVLSSGRLFVWGTEQESMFYHLSQKACFRQALQRLYWQDFRPLLLELVEIGMDRYMDQFEAGGILNSIRWDKHGSREAAEDHKNILLERIGFLDEYLGHEEDFCVISFSTLDFHLWRSVAVRRGETADFLSADGKTWLNYRTGEPFDVSVPVTEDWVLVQTENKEE